MINRHIWLWNGAWCNNSTTVNSSLLVLRFGLYGLCMGCMGLVWAVWVRYGLYGPYGLYP